MSNYTDCERLLSDIKLEIKNSYKVSKNLGYLIGLYVWSLHLFHWGDALEVEIFKTIDLQCSSKWIEVTKTNFLPLLELIPFKKLMGILHNFLIEELELDSDVDSDEGED